MFMRFIVFVIAIAGGIAASQAPEFAQQYRQRLGGAIDELARVLDNFDKDAATAGTDRSGGLSIMAQNDELLVRAQAVSMAQTIIRYDRLKKQQVAFAEAPPFARLNVFLNNYDGPLVDNTFRTFEPAVPATAEGVLFAGGGFVVIYVLLRFLGLIFRPRRRRHHQHPQPEQA